MAVTKVGHDQWHSSLTEGIYTSELAAKHYENLQRMKSMPESEGSKILAGLSTEQLKSLVDEMCIVADQTVSSMDWLQVSKEFCARNPDYIANNYNGGAMASLLVERGKLTKHGAFLGTMEDIEQAHYDLAERNVLERKPGAPLPKKPFDETAAYEMPLDELENRGRGW